MKLVFDETGNENKESILFLHPGGMSGWMWEQQIKHFKNYHCIIPDLPEHGRSASVKPFTIKRTAGMVAELVEDCPNELVNMVGIGLGGQIILQIMSKYPEIVDRAMVSGTLVRNHQYKSLIARLKELLMVYKPVKNSEFYIKAYMRTYHMPKVCFDKFKMSICQIETSSIERILIENHTFKLPPILETGETNLLVMAGEKDYNILKDSSKEIMNNYHARGALALGGGHLWNMETPDKFNEVLDAWLQNQPLPESLISPL
ncbi:MAG: alpha/beta hydrolase [Methanobacterium sp. ERen5]|nr:MAG: alpha/beta hydrolase [Methanobacterium sp. ERen5]